MAIEERYKEINKDSWNNKVEHHLQSDFYDVKTWLNGANSLNDIELEMLGDVSNKSILHLQCHFGQDTLSLARMGANVVGMDISDKAIEAAKSLAKESNLKAEFICCDLYELPEHCFQKFDIVFTSYGTIGWLPDIQRWANVVQHFLKSNGKFVFAEFHPVVWMFDNDIEKVEYRYFKSEAIVEELEGTYADRDAPIHQTYINWNHGLAEVIGSLLSNGLTLERFEEYDYSPYNCFKGMEEFEKSKFRIKSMGNKIPMVYSLSMRKM